MWKSYQILTANVCIKKKPYETGDFSTSLHMESIVIYYVIYMIVLSGNISGFWIDNRSKQSFQRLQVNRNSHINFRNGIVVLFEGIVVLFEAIACSSFKSGSKIGPVTH